ncbi:MAG: two-component system sensor histidine kinase NtrB [Terriglobales bacterium]
MKLKTKLTLSISVLVLLVVLAVTLVYLAGGMRQQLQAVYTHADFLAREVYNQMSQEWTVADVNGLGTPDGQAALQTFLQGLQKSPALDNLFSSAIGYAGAIRDVALIAPDGTVVMDSNPLLQGRRQPQRPDMSALMEAGLWNQTRAVLGPEMIYSINLGTRVAGQPMGTIAVGVDTVLLRQQMLGRMRHLLLYGLLIVLLATALAWSLAELALAPLAAISTQLDQMMAGATTARGQRRGDELGRVQSKIERLGQQMQDTRQIYSTLQENVSHVLSGMEEGVLLFDAQGNSVMASAAVPRLLGLPAAELVGQPVEALFPGEGSLDRSVRDAVRQRQPLRAHESERHAGGRRLMARLDVIRDQQGESGALLTLRDAEPINRLEGELEVARRLSAVGRLTRGVAHEVKNPLNAMAIHLDLLRAKASRGSDGLGPHIEVIGHSIERLDRVVRTFLDFSRPVELRLAPVDLSEVAQSVAQLVHAEATAKGIPIELCAPRPGPRVWLDRDLIEQALLNLVNNGLQAMEAAGTARRRPLTLEVLQQEQQAVLRIRDHGPGIAPEHRDKIFDLYFTTRSEGTGIGLALAARIMQLHHGAIELEAAAADEPGASFLLHFPLRAEDPAHQEAALAL